MRHPNDGAPFCINRAYTVLSYCVFRLFHSEWWHLCSGLREVRVVAQFVLRLLHFAVILAHTSAKDNAGSMPAGHETARVRIMHAALYRGTLLQRGIPQQIRAVLADHLHNATTALNPRELSAACRATYASSNASSRDWR
jgi:hypothetical protein